MKKINFRQIVALGTVLLLIITGLNLNAIADEVIGSSGTIVSFEELPSSICIQEFRVGASSDEIVFPTSLTATVEKEIKTTKKSPVTDTPIAPESPSNSGENIIPESPSESEETITPESSSDSEETIIPESTSDPEEATEVETSPDLEEPIESNSTVEPDVLPDQDTDPEDTEDEPFLVSLLFPAIVAQAEELETVTSRESVVFEDLSWKIDSARSTYGRFDFDVESTYFLVPDISWLYTVNADLPTIEIRVVPAENNRPAVIQSVVVDGVKITVTADEGVFPEGTTLDAKRITGEEELQTEQLVDVKTDNNNRKNLQSRYTFDIKMLNSAGEEVQPDVNAGKVTVSFQAEELRDSNLDAEVYHIDQYNNVDELDVVEENTSTLKVETTGFSKYMLVFSSGAYEWTIYNHEPFDIAEIANNMGIALGQTFSGGVHLDDVNDTGKVTLNSSTDSEGKDHCIITPTPGYLVGDTLELTIKYDAGDVAINITLQNYDHVWTYTSSYDINANKIIIANCSHCTIEPQKCWLSASDKDYDGAPVEITLNKDSDFPVPELGAYALSDTYKYYKVEDDNSKTELGAAPTEIGRYIAELTFTPTNGTPMVLDCTFTIRLMAGYHKINVINGIGGASYSVSPSDIAKTHEQVTIKLTPQSGYKTEKIVVKDKDDNDVVFFKISGNVYRFCQPDSDVTVSVSYKEGTTYTLDVYADPYYTLDPYIFSTGTVEITNETKKDYYNAGDTVIIKIVPNNNGDFYCFVSNNYNEITSINSSIRCDYIFNIGDAWNAEEHAYYYKYTMPAEDVVLVANFYKDFTRLKKHMVTIFDYQNPDSSPCVGDLLTVSKVVTTFLSNKGCLWLHAEDVNSADTMTFAELSEKAIGTGSSYTINTTDVGKSIVLCVYQTAFNGVTTYYNWFLSEKTPAVLRWVTYANEPEITSQPVAKTNLIYSGEEKYLIEPGTAEHGQIVYSFSSDGTFTDKIPTKKDAGTYTIWWKVIGESVYYKDTSVKDITVTIAPNPDLDSAPDSVTTPESTSDSEPNPEPDKKTTPAADTKAVDDVHEDMDKEMNDDLTLAENTDDIGAVEDVKTTLNTQENIIDTSLSDSDESIFSDDNTQYVDTATYNSPVSVESNKSVMLKYGDGSVEIAMINNTNTTEGEAYSAGLSDAKATVEAILSDELLARVESGSKVKIKVKATPLLDYNIIEDEKDIIESSIEDLKATKPNIVQSASIDIALLVKFDHYEWDYITSTRRPIEITVKLPNDENGLFDTCYILRVHDGETTLLEDLDQDKETFTIESNKFSTYTILYEKAEISGDNMQEEKFAGLLDGKLGWVAAIISLLLVILKERHEIKVKRYEHLKKARNHKTLL